MKRFKLMTLLLLIIMISCGKNIEKETTKTKADLIRELKSVPESITVENNTLFLTTYLWRNLMPGPDQNGGPLACVNTLTEKDSLSISSSIKLIKQYVITDDDLWSSSYTEITKPKEYMMRGMVREGPKWDPDITVDVVCEFENNGKMYRVLARSQVIHVVQ